MQFIIWLLEASLRTVYASKATFSTSVGPTASGSSGSYSCRQDPVYKEVKLLLPSIDRLYG